MIGEGGGGASFDNIRPADNTKPAVPERAVNQAPRTTQEIANSLVQLLVDRAGDTTEKIVIEDLLDKNISMIEDTVSNLKFSEIKELSTLQQLRKGPPPPTTETFMPPPYQEPHKEIVPITRLTDAQRAVAGEYLVIALLSQDPQNAELVKQLRTTYEADARNATIHPTIFGKWRTRTDPKIGEEIARIELIIEGLIKGPSKEKPTIGYLGRWKLDKDHQIVEKEGGEWWDRRQEELKDQSVQYGGRKISYAEDPTIVTQNCLDQNPQFAEKVADNLGLLKTAVAGKK